jgi:hypothetical protein
MQGVGSSLSIGKRRINGAHMHTLETHALDLRNVRLLCILPHDLIKLPIWALFSVGFISIHCLHQAG